MVKEEREHKRVIIWVHDLDREFLKYLREENIDIVAVIQAESKEGIPSISPFDLFYNSGSIPFDECVSRYIQLDDTLLNRYQDCISRVSFIPMTEAFTYREIGVVLGDNVVDWAQFHAQAALQLLHYYKPDEIWITHIPHLGLDNILVEVGRQLGITVLTLQQSIMSAKFFFNIIGFDGKNQLDLEFTGAQKGAFETNLFYMDQQDSLSPVGRFFERIQYYATAPFTKKRSEIIQRLYLAIQKRDQAFLLLMMDCICSRTRDVAFTRYIRRSRLRKELRKRAFCTPEDYEKPFVYFALHLQPEQTTSALGGLFSNQLNAIEALSDILPKEWQVYIKENPKQRYMYRDLPFFLRVRQWSHVKFIDDLSSRELIEKARLIATINGTVGYEAITHGKPCVYFGEAWFSGLPNTFAFNKTLDLEAISEQRTDYRKLDAAVKLKMKQAADGVIFPYYRGLLDSETDWSQVMRITAKSMARISDAAGSTGQKYDS